MLMGRLPATVLLSCVVNGALASQWNDQYLKGLEVHVESAPGQIYVNGLGVQFVQVTGADADRVTARILSQWRAEAGTEPLSSQSVGPWLIHSRLHDGASQVLQERTADGGTELLWSMVSLQQSLRAVPKPVVSLPADCILGQTVHGGDAQASFAQFTAACSGVAPGTLEHVRRLAVDHGYVLTRSDDRSFAAARGSHLLEAQIVAAGKRASEARSFGLVLLQRSLHGVLP